MSKKWYWHTYYLMLAEYLSDEEYKDAICHHQRIATEPNEHYPQDVPKAELRLKLIKPVKGEFPKALVDAHKLYDEAWVLRHEKQWKEFLKVQDIFSNVRNILYDSEHSNKSLAIEIKNLYEKAKDTYFNPGAEIFSRLCNAYYEIRGIYAKEIRLLHEKECPNCPLKNTERAI